MAETGASVTCICGAKVRWREEFRALRIACPKCRATLVAPPPVSIAPDEFRPVPPPEAPLSVPPEWRLDEPPAILLELRDPPPIQEPLASPEPAPFESFEDLLKSLDVPIRPASGGRQPSESPPAESQAETRGADAPRSPLPSTDDSFLIDFEMQEKDVPGKLEDEPLDAAVFSAEAPPSPAPPVVAKTCPVCQSPVASGEAERRCPSCETVHHSECWAEMGGCAVYGCKSAHAVPKAEPARRPPTAWGDTKECPVCNRTLKAAALYCRGCRSEFDTPEPMTRREYRVRQQERASLKSLKTWTVTVFVLSFVPCLSPITFLAAVFGVIPQRRRLVQLGGAYPALGYIAAGVSFVFSTIFAAAVGA